MTEKAAPPRGRAKKTTPRRKKLDPKKLGAMSVYALTKYMAERVETDEFRDGYCVDVTGVFGDQTYEFTLWARKAKQ